jgi:hypothetical protein
MSDRFPIQRAIALADEHDRPWQLLFGDRLNDERLDRVELRQIDGFSLSAERWQERGERQDAGQKCTHREKLFHNAIDKFGDLPFADRLVV